MNDKKDMSIMTTEENKSDIRIFAERLKEKLQSRFVNCLINVQEVTKNNGVILTGITMGEHGCKAAPTIYLENFFDQYQKGTSWEVIINMITNQYENMEHHLQIPDFCDFSKVERRICYKLINAGKNADLLCKVPHRIYHDLAIIYYILVNKDGNGISSVKVNNELLAIWQKDENALYDIASHNTPLLMENEITTLPGMMSELLSQTECIDKNLWDLEGAETEDVLVVSNCYKVEGASTILYRGVLQKIARRLGGDFYLLPSSIHEVICMPCRNCHNEQELVTMVRQVNAECVLEEEVLSDNVYCYDTATDSLRMIQ